MSLAIVHSRAQIGVEAPAVTVEAHLANGLPALTLVGLPETAVKESKDRVRSAILTSGFDFPPDASRSISPLPICPGRWSLRPGHRAGHPRRQRTAARRTSGAAGMPGRTGVVRCLAPGPGRAAGRPRARVPPAVRCWCREPMPRRPASPRPDRVCRRASAGSCRPLQRRYPARALRGPGCCGRSSPTPTWPTYRASRRPNAAC